MARMKGAELITEYLIKNKIPYVFGICGHGNVGMLDPLYHARDRIKMISPRHEQVAAHMADCYFRVRHEPVAMTTKSLGALITISSQSVIAIAQAMREVVIIAVASSQVGKWLPALVLLFL